MVTCIMGLIDTIDPAMEVESGLNCSCPLTMQDAAARSAEQARAILDLLGDGPHKGCRGFVHSRATIDSDYFGAVAEVGDTVCDYIDNAVDISVKMGNVIDRLGEVEERIKGDVYESELRSHRLGLEGLRDSWPRLHVDRANVIYCYPFAVPWADPSSLVDAANSLDTECDSAQICDKAQKQKCENAQACDRPDKWGFYGLTANVRPFELTDMWDSPDALDGKEEGLFTGVTVAFEESPHIKTRAQEILAKQDIELADETFSLEIRLSRLGNHYLRFQHQLNDATIHDLNQSMRRAMQQMGDEKVIFGLHEWPRLFELAEELIKELVAHLEPHIRTNELGEELGPTRPRITEPGFVRTAYPHVIVTARKLSLEQQGYGENNLIDRDLSIDVLIREAKGLALLLQPVAQAAAVLEEWSRYSLPDTKDGNTMQPLSFVGNFAYRTTNTTFGLLRGTPEYLIAEHEEAAEFVATLPVLLESWMSQIRQRASHGLKKDPSTDDISERQLQLRLILNKATTVIAQIHSPDLCLTAVHRKYLDQMFAIAGIDRLEGELQSHFSVLDAHLNTLSTMASRREQKRNDMQGFFFGAGAVLVGVPSLAAVFALFDDGYGVHRSGEKLEAFILSALIVLLLVAVFKLPGAHDVLVALKQCAQEEVGCDQECFRQVAWRGEDTRQCRRPVPDAAVSKESGGPSDPTSVVDLADRPDAALLLDQLYREILVPSFRKDELDPLATISEALEVSPRRVDVAAARGLSGEILGAMICEWDPSSRVYLLSYLAARPGVRGRGVGTCLMRHLPEWSRARRALVTLAEVDDPRRHAVDGFIGDPLARLSFYERFGARVLDVPYFQPSLTTGGRRAHGMLLLAFDVDDEVLVAGPVPALRGDVLGRFLRGYFADSEGAAKPDVTATDDPDLRGFSVRLPRPPVCSSYPCRSMAT